MELNKNSSLQKLNNTLDSIEEELKKEQVQGLRPLTVTKTKYCFTVGRQTAFNRSTQNKLVNTLENTNNKNVQDKIKNLLELAIPEEVKARKKLGFLSIKEAIMFYPKHLTSKPSWNKDVHSITTGQPSEIFFEYLPDLVKDNPKLFCSGYTVKTITKNIINHQDITKYHPNFFEKTKDNKITFTKLGKILIETLVNAKATTEYSKTASRNALNIIKKIEKELD